MKSKTCLSLSILTIALSLGEVAQAANYTWDGTGNWTDLNWSPGSVTGPTTSTDTATINSGTVTITGLTIASAISIATGATLEANAQEGVGNVTLNGNLTGSGILNKTGGWTLILSGDNSGFSGTINATASNTFFAADSAGSAAADWVITNGAKIISNQSGTGHVIQLGSLAGDSGYLGNNGNDNSVTFEIGGKGNSTSFAGQIVDTPPGWGSSTTAIKVVGGTLTLTGSNGYTGSTTVTGGTLNLQDTVGAAGTNYNGGNININGASTLRVSGLRYNFNGETFTFDSVGGGTIDAIASGAGGMVFMGNNTFATSGGAQNIISGTKSGNEGFNLNGSSAIFNVITGSDTTSDLKVTGTLWNGGNVTKNGTGRMEISAPQQYSGTTTVNEGTLILGDGTNNVGLSNSHDVVIESGATLRLNYPVGSPDSIDELTLGGVLQAPGIYGAGTYSGVTITGTGTLNVLNGPIADPFANWMATNFPGILSPNNQPEADPDNDGIKNLLEYVLQGGNPSVSTTGTLPTVNASGVNFVFTYYRRAAATGVTQTFQYSPDLGVTPWVELAIPGGSGVSVTDQGGGIDKVEIIVAKGANTKLFGRLQVVK